MIPDIFRIEIFNYNNNKNSIKKCIFNINTFSVLSGNDKSYAREMFFLIRDIFYAFIYVVKLFKDVREANDLALKDLIIEKIYEILDKLPMFKNDRGIKNFKISIYYGNLLLFDIHENNNVEESGYTLHKENLYHIKDKKVITLDGRFFKEKTFKKYILEECGKHTKNESLDEIKEILDLESKINNEDCEYKEMNKIFSNEELFGNTIIYDLKYSKQGVSRINNIFYNVNRFEKDDIESLPDSSKFITLLYILLNNDKIDSEFTIFIDRPELFLDSNQIIYFSELILKISIKCDCKIVFFSNNNICIESIQMLSKVVTVAYTSDDGDVIKFSNKDNIEFHYSKSDNKIWEILSNGSGTNEVYGEVLNTWMDILSKRISVNKDDNETLD